MVEGGYKAVIPSAPSWHNQEPLVTLSNPGHVVDARPYHTADLIMHRCFQLAHTDVQSTLLWRLSHQHVVLWWTAFRLHGHHLHQVPMSLCFPRPVQVYQTHTLFTCRGQKDKNTDYNHIKIKVNANLRGTTNDFLNFFLKLMIICKMFRFTWLEKTQGVNFAKIQDTQNSQWNHWDNLIAAHWWRDWLTIAANWLSSN